MNPTSLRALTVVCLFCLVTVVGTPALAQTVPGLVAHYAFDDSGNPGLDSSGSDLQGEFMTGGHALRPDGTEDRRVVNAGDGDGDRFRGHPTQTIGDRVGECFEAGKIPCRRIRNHAAVVYS